MTRLPPRLIGLSPGRLDGTAGAEARLIEAVRSALGAGLGGVLLREPALLDGPFLALARVLRALLPSGRGWLGLHDRAHLVAAAGADGLHLGFRSLAPAAARTVVGDSIALGLSTHAGDGREGWDALDYRSFGPLHKTPSKAGLVEPVGVAGLAREVASGGPPCWALGGVDPGAAGPALEAGACGVIARAALLGAADPAAATVAFLTAMGKGAGA